MQNGERTMCFDLITGVPRNELIVRYGRYMDLTQIANSGQCFRLVENPQQNYVAITGNHMVEISRSENGYVFCCSFDEFMDVWYSYFDYGTDYWSMQDKMQDDPFLRDAVRNGSGIRILRQNVWETVVTFVISQRNNIPRIRASVNRLCQEYGTMLGYDSFGNAHYSFPTHAQLRGRDLSVASLGYRAKYVDMLTHYNESFWDAIPNMSDIEAKETLLSIYGVGEKVANCIMLFGLHRMNIYPRDVWINRMIDDVYRGDFDADKYDGFAGYVQQLQFYYYRMLQKGGAA